jgi:hypothetical protein
MRRRSKALLTGAAVVVLVAAIAFTATLRYGFWPDSDRIVQANQPVLPR